jgi:putative FmdB family regulatory protein
MPTYQYACTSDECGLRFERVQAFTDAAISECPDCNDRVRKVYGSVGVVFKGSGFYRNDSRDAKASASAAKADSESGTSKSDSDKASDSGADSAKSAKAADSGSAGGSPKPAAKAESSKPAAAVGS